MGNLILTLASWMGCFWLGFQIGKGRSELLSNANLVELERRFKIVDCEAIEIASAENTRARP